MLEAQKLDSDKITPYQAVSIENTGQDIDQVSTETIADWVCQMVQVEAPVHKQLVWIRLGSILDPSQSATPKAGSKVANAVDQGIELALSQGKIRAVDEIREDEEGNKRYYWFYYRTDTDLIPARNWELASNRHRLLISDEELESMAHVLFGPVIKIEDTEQATKQIWNALSFDRVSQNMIAQTEPVLRKITIMRYQVVKLE